jgi:3-phosphoshikimate 1-carboxyvinyltransferase
MTTTISPSKIHGTLAAPASKSSMQRACAAALLRTGVTTIHNAGISNDDKAALDIITQLGAKIYNRDGVLEIISQGFSANNNTAANINCGESGLSIRMFSPIAALSSTTINITGEGSLQKRPMDFFDEIFPKLGIEIISADGKLPLQIKGPLQPKDITIDGSLSSQFLTGLLFAFGQAATEQVTITVIDLKSKPYIDLTLHIMKHFGFNIEHDNYERFIINPKTNNHDEKMQYTVEGDWSSASFLLVAGAIAGEVTVKGLDVFSTQADKAILQVLQLCKAHVSISEEEIVIKKNTLIPFVFDATDCPDLFPPMVALASYCEGKSVIYGIHRLAAKESDRAKTLQDIFGKMGIKITLQEDDAMIIEGGKINAATVSSHHDHRIAMAAAIAALGAEGDITITEANAINKSYPQFYEDIKQLAISRGQSAAGKA